jgi:hypothetical protein
MMKIYCDTDTLLHDVNAYFLEANELEALRMLLMAYANGVCSMVRSRVVLREPEATGNLKADFMRADYQALRQIENDERVGFACSQDPLVSNVQDDDVWTALIQGGLSVRDAHHVTEAKCNDCNVFLTRDGQIIKRRGWIEGWVRGLKVRLPSEVVSERLSSRP